MMKKNTKKLGILVLLAALVIGVVLMSGCAASKEQQPPTSDAAGKDISDIPRYTGSVRTYYGSVPGVSGSNIVEYLTPASVNTVTDFYATQLPANGWTIYGTEEISALKEKQGMAVIIIKDSKDYSGYTTINITFSPETAQP